MTFFEPKNNNLSTKYACIKLVIKRYAFSCNFVFSLFCVAEIRTSFKTMSQENVNTQDAAMTSESLNLQGGHAIQNLSNESTQKPAGSAASNAEQ